MISYFTYSLPFLTPFKTGSSLFKLRKGVIVRYFGVEDSVAEAAPLPGFSSESLEDVLSFFTDHSVRINHFLDSSFTVQNANSFLSDLPKIPSARFAVSMLALSVLSQRSGCKIEELLKIDNTPDRLSVNSVIGTGTETEIYSAVQSAVSEGFTTVKLKVHSSPHSLAAVLTKAAAQFPGILFRLDANRSWPFEKLSHYSSLFKNLPIEYIEEPAQYNGDEELEKMVQASALPVALDESVNSPERLLSALKNHPKTTLVIKPTLFGNFIQLVETISAYRSSFDQIVVTTALESAVGRSMVTEAAFLIGDRSLAHGLNTGRLLAGDLLDNRTPLNGIFSAVDRDFTQLRFDRLNQTFLKS